MELTVNTNTLELEIINFLISNNKFIPFSNELLINQIHKDIYSIIEKLYYAKKEINYLNIINDLKINNAIDFILNITSENKLYSTETELNNSLEILKRNYIKIVKNSCDEDIKNANCFDEKKKIIDFYQNKIKDIDSKNDLKFKTASELIQEVLEDISLRDNKEIQIYKTNYKNIDNIIGGFEGGQLNIIAARTSVGKTTFSLDLIINFLKNNHKCYVLSLEMKDKKIMKKFLTNYAYVQLNTLNQNKNEIDKLTNGIMEFESLCKEKLFIDEKLTADIDDLKHKIRRLKNEKNVNIFCLDHLLLLRCKHGKDRRQQIEYITRELKLLAVELDVVILLITQLNRNMANRTNNRPLITDLKESGSIEQDADMVMLLNKPETNIDKLNKSVLEIFIDKNRDGETGKASLMFLRSYGKFFEIENGSYTYEKNNNFEEEEDIRY